MPDTPTPPHPDRPRFFPDEPFPPYTFVPGQQPHPVSDPRGHSFGRTEQLGPGAFLCGVDLFNHGYYWEAHEAWESLWRACERSSPRAVFLKGLIHLAAAGVKVREGLPAGVLSHARRAEELFQQLTALPHEFGLSLDQLTAYARDIAIRSGSWPAQQGSPVAVIFPFLLHPASKLQPVEMPDAQPHGENHGG